MSAAGFALLPVAVGVAVLRYRLFEIDRIVSRTVSYGLLSAALVGLYLLVVALLRPLLEPLTGSSALAVAALDAGGGGGVQPRPSPAAGGGGPAVRPGPVRRRPCGGRLRRAAARPGRPGRDHRRPARHRHRHRRPRPGRPSGCAPPPDRGVRAMYLRTISGGRSPWVLCAVSLSLYVLSNVLRLAAPQRCPRAAHGVARRHHRGTRLRRDPHCRGLDGLAPARQSRTAGCGARWASPTGCPTSLDRSIQAVDGPLWAAWVMEAWGFLIALGMLVLVFLLFPTGRCAEPPVAVGRPCGRDDPRAADGRGALLRRSGRSDRGRPRGRCTGWPVGMLVRAAEAGLFAMFLLVLAGMVSLVLRFRRRPVRWSADSSPGSLYATVAAGSLLVLDGVLGVPTGGPDRRSGECGGLRPVAGGRGHRACCGTGCTRSTGS